MKPIWILLVVVLPAMTGCAPVEVVDVTPKEFMEAYDRPTAPIAYFYDGVRDGYHVINESKHYEHGFYAIRRLRVPVRDMPAGFPERPQKWKLDLNNQLRGEADRLRKTTSEKE